jgi:hypothetical protein
MSIELNAIAFADATSFTALAVRFLDVCVPGSDQTWRDFIESYVAEGNPFVAADVPFIAFLNSPVDKVQGYTWGDSIEMSEAAGVEVDLSGLPLDKFILKLAGIVIIDGADFADSKVSQLIGHPDGYVGYEGGSSLFNPDSGSRLPERYLPARKLPVLLDVDFDVRGLTRWPDHCVVGSDQLYPDTGAYGNAFLREGESSEHLFRQSVLAHEVEHSLGVQDISAEERARQRRDTLDLIARDLGRGDLPVFVVGDFNTDTRDLVNVSEVRPLVLDRDKLDAFEDGLKVAMARRPHRTARLFIDPQLPFLQNGRLPVSK